MITFPLLGQTGRLGNQLWQIASTLGIAAARNEQARFPHWAYEDFFSVPLHLFDTEVLGTPADTFPTHIDERTRVYLQDYALFKDIEPMIREYFKPSDLALDTLRQINGFWDLETPRCSLHVRRGDNITEGAWKQSYYPPRTMEYYNAALAAIEYKSLAIFSDDIPWCRQQFGDRADFYYDGIARPKEHEAEYQTAPILDWIDLQLMCYADFHVLSNSTYSWWGAFLSKDPSPIYPDHWYGPKLSFVDASLMMPAHWREFPC